MCRFSTFFESYVGVTNVMGLGAGENLIRFNEADTCLFILDL